MRDLEFHSAAGSIAPPCLQQPLLETIGLSFSAGGTRLLQDVSLEVRPGSRTLIMGPNGAGKSLLLRLMHGLLRPETGNILWNGAKLTAEARRSQAMVFQRPVLLRRSVFANLKFALSVRGLNGRIRSEKIEQALAIAGLSHLAKRPARVLSGGEQQRLAVVRALACEPDLLFLDEPTANLDPASTAAIEQLVLEANSSGVTIVMVTHDAGQAKRIGEDLVFLQDGKIAETGDVQQVLSAPKSEPVRAWRDGRIYLGANIETMSDKSGRRT